MNINPKFLITLILTLALVFAVSSLCVYAQDNSSEKGRSTDSDDSFSASRSGPSGPSGQSDQSGARYGSGTSGQSGPSGSHSGSGSKHRRIIVPYYFPAEPYYYTGDTYFRRLLEDYERANSDRFNDIQQDMASIGDDLKYLFNNIKTNNTDSDTIIRKLEKIERDLAAVNGRVKKLETTIVTQSRVINRISKRLGENFGEPNRPAVDPNSNK